MKRIAAALDHDILIRHFVLNGVLQALENEWEVHWIFPEKHKRVTVDVAALGLSHFHSVPVDNQRMYRYRRLHHAAALRNLRRHSPRHRSAVSRFFRDVLGGPAYRRSWFASRPLAYQLYRRWILRKIGSNAPLERLLEKIQPDVIVHPTVLEGLFVSDLVEIGRKKGIPTLYIMNSWDNPATKAMMQGQPDRLAVWGEQTKEHATKYLGIDPAAVICLGAAQFDVYHEPPRQSRENYRRQLGIPEERTILLYAGSSKGLNETRHLQMLEKAVEDRQLKNCAVLFRPHPWRKYPENEADFHSLEWKHVWMEPTMDACYRAGRQGEHMPVELADYRDTHVVLNAVDAVISPLSTILLEAALHGKPVAAYLPNEDMKRNAFLFTVTNMVHFSEFFERVDCIKCESPEDLVPDCARLLELANDPETAARLLRQCDWFIAPSKQGYAQRLAAVLEDLTSADRVASAEVRSR